MSFSERYNEGRGNLINNGDQNNLQNNLPGSHNQPTISQQQNFGGGGDLTVVQEQQRMAPPIIQWTSHVRWTQELRILFVDTVKKLGGPDSAKPKDIVKEMAIPGLTLSHVKSYLQRVRNGTTEQQRRPSRRSNRRGMGDQNGVGLQIQTAGFQDHNGVFYPLQPGNDNPWVQHAPVGVGLQEQTPDFQDQNGVFYPFQPGNDNPWVQHAQVGVGLQEQTPDFQDQNEVNNFEPGNELACVVQQEYELAQVVQQPARDGGALGNIQQQNQPQAATDTVQAQNATVITQDNMEDLDDYFNYESYFREPFGIARQTL